MRLGATSLSADELRELAASLEIDGSLHTPFFVLILTSCAIATFGLIANSAAVVIGAMIIAPLMSPMAALAFGLVNGEARMMRRSAITIATGAVLSVLFSALLARLTGLPSYGSEILARSQPTVLDLGVALAAGIAAVYARIRPQLAATLAGTAIAVALMPPLCTIGIALSHLDGSLARGAALLFVSNLFGITFAGMLTYAVAGLVHWERARNGFIWATLLVVIVAIPLFAQFARLLNQTRLEQTLRTALIRGTVTFQRVDLVGSDFDWLTDPPTVILLVRSSEPITPTQVRFLEAYAQRKTGHRFTLIVRALRQQDISDTPSPAPSRVPHRPDLSGLTTVKAEPTVGA